MVKKSKSIKKSKIKKVKKPAKKINSKEVFVKKNKWIAAILSFLVVGLGQLYLRKYKKAALFFFGSLLSVFLAMLIFSYAGVSEDVSDLIAQSIGIGFMVASVFDAWVLAQFKDWEEYKKHLAKKRLKK